MHVSLKIIVPSFINVIKTNIIKFNISFPYCKREISHSTRIYLPFLNDHIKSTSSNSITNKYVKSVYIAMNNFATQLKLALYQRKTNSEIPSTYYKRCTQS